MVLDFLVELIACTLTTLRIYFVAWIVGTLVGIVISYGVWYSPKNASKKAYLILSGISFIPITIFIPYFIRGFGLDGFIYPILAVPVALITFASTYEAFQHSNKYRLTLLINYQQTKFSFFWSVVFRESMPSIKTVARQTLSLCFAIFIALDFFVEYWNGLGALVQKYYSRLAFDAVNHYYMLTVIVMTGLVGMLQVYLNDRLFRRWTEFRRHY